jgi:hypothetical protein
MIDYNFQKQKKKKKELIYNSYKNDIQLKYNELKYILVIRK